ncbi:hypothetical protein ANCDUO_17722 [Ancylostoma duodenale]|uniref:Uncharacterized protein n=1 Tax=Ancylostoma duodenale TaxID=51022 RepID=A0A0C2C7B5_9BILA|nr:hypothetical protein ANCDUO_17722 [Ancylostoma duodenale]
MKASRVATVQRKKRSQPAVKPAPAAGLDDESIEASVELLKADNSIPLHVKRIRDFLLQNLVREEREYAAVKAHEVELESENKKLRDEVNTLNAKLVLKSTNSPEPPAISSPASVHEVV